MPFESALHVRSRLVACTSLTCNPGSTGICSRPDHGNGRAIFASMESQLRYLQFENIHLLSERPMVSSRCTACNREFKAEIQSTERLEDVLLRIRDEFNVHDCKRDFRNLPT